MQDEGLHPIASEPLYARILLLESDEGRGEVLRSLLRTLGCRVRSVSTQKDIQSVFHSRTWDAIFCDMCFAEEAIPLAEAANPSVQLILLASYDELTTARGIVDSGRAFGFLPTPVRSEKAIRMLREALAQRPARRDGESAGVEAGGSAGDASSVERHFGMIVGESAPMQELYRQIEKVASSEMTVLILGESGTGKELVAKAIHGAGCRSQQPFIPVNCSSLPENLLESELFGYVRGAFTGAVHNKDGLFVAANGGTLFLDEIGSIPLPTQMALLRALQEREVRPVGSTQAIPVNVRVVAATNEDVEKLKDEGKIRQDLFYRISAFQLRVPPLREREGDIDLLVNAFLDGLAEGNPARATCIAPDAWKTLRAHPWPGNVRELLHALERGATLAEKGVIRRCDLPPEILDRPQGQEEAIPEAPSAECMTLKAYLRACERQYLQKVLAENGGDKEKAARLLGISVATIYRKLSEI